MRKDIVIPEVKDVHVAVVKEWNEEFSIHDWNIYLINDSKLPMEGVMLMSRGMHKDGRKTTTFRQAFPVVAAKSALKIELIMEDVFPFTNEFLLTFFSENVLYDRKYVAPPYSIKESNFTDLPIMSDKGYLVP